MEQIFKEIGKIMQEKSFTTFQIIGFKHVDFIVKLQYRDCDEYYRASYKDNGEFHPLKRLGYSKNRKLTFEIDTQMDLLEQEIENTLETN